MHFESCPIPELAPQIPSHSYPLTREHARAGLHLEEIGDDVLDLVAEEPVNGNWWHMRSRLVARFSQSAEAGEIRRAADEYVAKKRGEPRQ